MEWIKIDKDKLPEYTVLAANFEPGEYGYKEKIIGYLSVDKSGMIYCEDENQVLKNCTHYIDINKFDVS